MFVGVLFGSNDVPDSLKTFRTSLTDSTTYPLPTQSPWSGGSTVNWFPPRA